jgi:hypothetical protein
MARWVNSARDRRRHASHVRRRATRVRRPTRTRVGIRQRNFGLARKCSCKLFGYDPAVAGRAGRKDD